MSKHCGDNTPLSNMCTPTIAKVNPETGELYVIDEWPYGFKARLLIFEPPFMSGMSASRVVFPKNPDFNASNKWNYFFQATGFIFNTYKEGEYATGDIWINEHKTNRTILINKEGNIIKVIGAVDENNLGCQAMCNGPVEQNFNLCWPGGSPAIDDNNNIYLADERYHRITRFSLPYELSNNGACLPVANGGLFEGNKPNNVSASSFFGGVGTFVFKNQLVIKDLHRFLVWENYLEKNTGSPVDFVVENFAIGSRAFHAIDDNDRLWLFNTHGKIMIYQLPLHVDSQPLANNLNLFWEDTGRQIDYKSYEVGIAFDPIGKAVWAIDRRNHRLLRISNYNDFNSKLYVDAVIGQPDKKTTCGNQTKKTAESTCKNCWIACEEPRANTLDMPYAVEFDNYGNLFVIDNTYEGHGNLRMTVFSAEDLAGINTLFPNLAAVKVFGPDSFTEIGTNIYDDIERFSPVSVAFNKQNQMIVGRDGYYKNFYGNKERSLKQLLFYRDPLKKNSDGSYVQGQKPDGYIRLPMGAPGEINFDENDNLIIQDHTWIKVWVINLEKDFEDWFVPTP